jgi:hypothetical protein
MKISACGDLLSTLVKETTIPVLGQTPIGKAAAIVIGMARAYADDGTTFFKDGDLVNALAAYWYGFGWLHFGWTSGFAVPPRDNRVPCPFEGSCENLPGTMRSRLEEKTRRYAHLLTTARASVTMAMEPAAPGHDFAGRMMVIVDCYAMRGQMCMARGLQEDALTSFSYAHGWLDAGARTGFFQVVRNRDIFTV